MLSHLVRTCRRAAAHQSKSQRLYTTAIPPALVRKSLRLADKNRSAYVRTWSPVLNPVDMYRALGAMEKKYGQIIDTTLPKDNEVWTRYQLSFMVQFIDQESVLRIPEAGDEMIIPLSKHLEPVHEIGLEEFIDLTKHFDDPNSPLPELDSMTTEKEDTLGFHISRAEKVITSPYVDRHATTLYQLSTPVLFRAFLKWGGFKELEPLVPPRKIIYSDLFDNSDVDNSRMRAALQLCAKYGIINPVDETRATNIYGRRPPDRVVIEKIAPQPPITISKGSVSPIIENPSPSQKSIVHAQKIVSPSIEDISPSQKSQKETQTGLSPNLDTGLSSIQVAQKSASPKKQNPPSLQQYAKKMPVSPNKQDPSSLQQQPQKISIQTVSKNNIMRPVEDEKQAAEKSKPAPLTPTQVAHQAASKIILQEQLNVARKLLQKSPAVRQKQPKPKIVARKQPSLIENVEREREPARHDPSRVLSRLWSFFDGRK